MGNIHNYNYNKFNLRLSKDDYWDFFLAKEETYGKYVSPSSGDCLTVWYDFNNTEIYSTGTTSANTIYSLVTWDKAVNNGYTGKTIGLTGIDNGLITFNKLSADTSNIALLSALTGSTLIMPSGDTRLTLHRVTGSTNAYSYPIDILNDSTGSYAQLCGGFYQGFYKIDNSDYQVLPTRVNKAWVAEFWLKRDEASCSAHTETKLNTHYPNNKGFFFYMGTRAENKFWNTFNGVNSGCTSACTVPVGCTGTVSTYCTIPKETDINIIGDHNVLIPLNPPLINIDVVTNPFLIYGRAGESSMMCSSCNTKNDGLGTKNVCTYSGDGIVVTSNSQIITDTTNPFLIYGRAGESSMMCSSCNAELDGYGTKNVCTYTGSTSDQTELDYKVDIIDNALGFRIKDDGSIGYRLLTYTGTCITSGTSTTYVSGMTVQEAYSMSGMVEEYAWTNVVIRYVSDYLDDCQLINTAPRKGRLMFYINGYLKFVVNDFNEFIGKKLNEYYEKQIGVPFNFSLGGGSQGLAESQTFDGLDPTDRNLPIEQNFAGTFIGGISQFKFNICDLNFVDIQNTYIYEKERYSGVIIIPDKPAPSRVYYGKFTGSTITSADTLNNLLHKVTNKAVDSYVNVPAVNGYGYILIPNTLEQPVDLRDSLFGCTGFNIPYTTLPDIIISDVNGFLITYKVYRTFNTTSSSVNIWMCS